MAIIKKISELEQMEALSGISNIIIEENGAAKRFPAKEIGGKDRNPDCQAQYFDITNDGTISLKEEYRGASTQSTLLDSVSINGAGVAGSKNAQLPKYLVIPETVNGITVNSLAEGMFCDNTAIVEVVLPYMITAIPQYCFNGCSHLQEVYNTENITQLGYRSFRQCARLKRAKFPNLTSIGGYAFTGCGRLIYADVGDVAELPDLSFAYNAQLQRIKNNGKLKTVGDAAFCKATSLTYFENIEKLTNIDVGAFIGPKIDFDWNSLTGCALEENATPAQFNPSSIGSGCTYTPCVNPIPTYFAQTNPALKGRKIGTSGFTYDNGCMLFSFIHAYCGLKNLSLSSIEEIESFVTAADPNFLNNYQNSDAYLQTMAAAMGLQDEYYETCDNSTVQTLYDAVAAGKYALVPIDNGWGTMSGHIMVVYGINDDGELLAVDSSSRYYDDFSQPFTYSFQFAKTCSPNQALHILSLPESD